MNVGEYITVTEDDVIELSESGIRYNDHQGEHFIF